MFVWITKTLLWDQTPNTHNTANENKLMALREENLWWFNTWAVKSSGKLQPVRRCWGFSACQVLFHSPCWGTRSSAEWCWIMWLIAEEVSRIRAAGEKFEVAGWLIWLIAIWKRQRDAVILIPRSLTHCLVDFSFFTVLDSCFLLFTILSSAFRSLL